MSDRRLLYASAFVRSLATGYVGVLAALHLATAGLGDAAVGVVIACGLAGAAIAALAVTWAGDRIGRRRSLVTLALLGGAGGAAFALSAAPVFLALAALAGMVNGMGRDRGAALILEQAVLPATTDDAGRTRAFAAYAVAQDAGGAVGALLAAAPAILRDAGLAPLEASRTALLVYAGLALLPIAFYLRLSPGVETSAPRRGRLAPDSRARLTRLAALFALDSVGGGFLTSALLALFFHQRFGAGESELGALFFAAKALNAVSHVGAAWLARRIGLVNTMVFTHLPSSLLLATVTIAPSLPVAVALFLLREGLVEMDVPTRQSYVMAVVAPEERTFAAGVTHIVRMAGWAVAPALAGVLAEANDLGAPLLAGAALKISYDILLYAAFRRVRPPEESG
ncbi:MAG TPA: MFS transporter [Kofleriaceae bacterium]|jgi:MFS family permease